jgi:hypothetical protein
MMIPDMTEIMPHADNKAARGEDSMVNEAISSKADRVLHIEPAAS